jgi:isoquinoline 1-oxidoreductase alpha subunit
MPLLGILRDAETHWHKFRLRAGLCGSCTVHVNGTAAQLHHAVKAAAGKSITTIEGLSANGDHPAEGMERGQRAAVRLASLARSCRPSMLKKTPKPTDAQVVAACHGNICRCGTYQRIRTAIQLAAKVMA